MCIEKEATDTVLASIKIITKFFYTSIDKENGLESEQWRWVSEEYRHPSYDFIFYRYREYVDLEGPEKILDFKRVFCLEKHRINFRHTVEECPNVTGSFTDYLRMKYVDLMNLESIDRSEVRVATMVELYRSGLYPREVCEDDYDDYEEESLESEFTWREPSCAKWPYVPENIEKWALESDKVAYFYNLSEYMEKLNLLQNSAMV